MGRCRRGARSPWRPAAPRDRAPRGRARRRPGAGRRDSLQKRPASAKDNQNRACARELSRPGLVPHRILMAGLPEGPMRRQTLLFAALPCLFLAVSARAASPVSAGDAPNATPSLLRELDRGADTVPILIGIKDGTPSARALRASPDLEGEPERRIIRVAAQKRLAEELTPQRLAVKHYYESFSMLAGTATREAAIALAGRTDLLWVGLGGRAHLLQTTPQNSQILVRSDQTNALGFRGAGQAIAVIDTGVDYMVADLGGAAFPNTKVIGGTDIADNDSDPMDCEGHGSSIAAGAAGAPGASPRTRRSSPSRSSLPRMRPTRPARTPRPSPTSSPGSTTRSPTRRPSQSRRSTSAWAARSTTRSTTATATATTRAPRSRSTPRRPRGSSSSSRRETTRSPISSPCPPASPRPSPSERSIRRAGPVSAGQTAPAAFSARTSRRAPTGSSASPTPRPTSLSSRRAPSGASSRRGAGRTVSAALRRRRRPCPAPSFSCGRRDPTFRRSDWSEFSAPPEKG